MCRLDWLYTGGKGLSLQLRVKVALDLYMEGEGIRTRE
jgi:hypothetical protein